MRCSTKRARFAFEQAYGRAPSALWQAPGRVNLIGEHTDYNDGFVLPMAIDRRVVVAVGPGSETIRVFAADLDERDAFTAALPMTHGAGWVNYVRGVAAELLADGHAIPPLDLAIASDVPLGAGLSSSAALEIAVALALTDGQVSGQAAALIGLRAENDFVGCRCGIMDQLASSCAMADHALLIDCRALSYCPVPLPAGAAIVVIDSGIHHSNAAGGYNQRRAECERAAAHYRVTALRDLDEVALDARRAGLDDVAFRRARHIVTENARVLAFADVMKRNDLREMGKLMAASHRSMRDDFEITVPAIDLIVERLDRAIDGHGGARMTGGGFGGSVVALVPDTLVIALERAMRDMPGMAIATSLSRFESSRGAGRTSIDLL